MLHVSLGKKLSSIRVPNICGMSESAAVNRLLSSGFVVGDISYKSSSQKVGTVISQSISHTSRAKSGSMISFCVSAGQKFDGKIMPSLYGMSIDEAKRVLSQYGLVAGNIYAVKSTETFGTVISQSPAAGEEILPSLVGVDMYVSSSQ